MVEHRIQFLHLGGACGMNDEEWKWAVRHLAAEAPGPAEKNSDEYERFTAHLGIYQQVESGSWPD